MPTYRKATDDDFGEDGKGKPDLKIYESDDGDNPREPNNPLTEPIKDPNKKYVVEVTAADGDGGGDGGGDGDGDDTQPQAQAAAAVKTPAADAGSGSGPAAATAVDPPQENGGPSEQDMTFTLSVLQQSLAMDGIKEKKTPQQIKEIIKALFPSISTKDLDKMAADVQNGGRRRTKRKGRKGSKKSKKGAKKSKTSAKQSKKGGRSRKNRRKQSRRRKH